MKKHFFLFSSALTLLLALTSCNSNNTNALDLNKTLNFSTKTVEAQKQSIEQSGIDLVTKMDAMKQTNAMIALNQFSTNANGRPAFVKPLSELRTNLLRNDVKAFDTFNQQMRTAVATGDTWGVWTWNYNNKDFDYVSSPIKTATFLFPATANSRINSGELKITYVQSDVLVPDTNPVEYMPQSFSVVLKVSGVEALSASFTGSYKSDATPVNLKQTLTIEKYNWSIELTNNDKDVSAKYAFNYDKDVLLKYEVGASGSLTEKAIQSSTGPQDVFNSGAMYFQVMNVAFIGGFKDFKGFYAESNGLKKTYDKNYYNSSVVIINKYLKMYGYFVKENQKFADVEFYVTESIVIDWSSYNYNTGSYGTKTEYNYQPRLVLSDGSKVDIKKFVETGFEDLITKLQSY